MPVVLVFQTGGMRTGDHRLVHLALNYLVAQGDLELVVFRCNGPVDYYQVLVFLGVFLVAKTSACQAVGQDTWKTLGDKTSFSSP